MAEFNTVGGSPTVELIDTAIELDTSGYDGRYVEPTGRISASSGPTSMPPRCWVPPCLELLQS